VAGKGITIAFDDPSGPRAIAKLVGARDGGVTVLFPYHRHTEGMITKVTAQAGQLAGPVRTSPQTLYRVSGRIKLSIHASGFVQLSGEPPAAVISGIDGQGHPKGFGVFSAPLTDPIQSGPTTIIVAYGLSEFQLAQPSRSVLFDEGDVEYAWPNSNAYAFHVWLFPRGVLTRTHVENGRQIFSQIRHWFYSSTCQLYHFRIIDVGSPLVVAGVLVERQVWYLTADSGIWFGTPRDVDGHNFTAAYPPWQNPATEASSGDYRRDRTVIPSRDIWPPSEEGEDDAYPPPPPIALPCLPGCYTNEQPPMSPDIDWAIVRVLLREELAKAQDEGE